MTDRLWTCTLEFHEDNFSRENVLINRDVIDGFTLDIGSLAKLAPYRSTKSDHRQALRTLDTDSVHTATPTIRPVGRVDDDPRSIDHSRSLVFTICQANADQRAKKPGLQVSIHASVRQLFGYSNRMQVAIMAADSHLHSANFVELAFRDQYLARSDMWRLTVAELSRKAIVKGQQLLFMGTVRASVKNIFIRGKKVASALVSSATVPIFRSESAKYTFFIQMSREMWDYDAEGSGEIMFNKVINGFLPDLFRRWQRLHVRHLVTVILFSRLEYEHGILRTRDHRPDGGLDHRDYYRVVTADASSSDWVRILTALKQEFTVFLRDTLILPGNEAFGRKPDSVAEVKSAPEVECVIAGRPTPAKNGNVLEAINLASSQFAQDYVDRDLVRTGISLVIITAGTGVFEVDYSTLKLTTDTLVGNGIGIDLVSIAPMPLHSVPLFRYHAPRAPSPTTVLPQSFGSATPTAHRPKSISPSKTPSQRLLGLSRTNTQEVEWSYALPHWVDVSFWTSHAYEYSADPSEGRITRTGKVKPAFQANCSMYELQMMGLMENEMASIAIPFLPPTPNIDAEGRRRPMPEMRVTDPILSTSLAAGSPLQRHHLVRDDTASPLKGSIEAYEEVDVLARQQMVQWMVSYDQTVFGKKEPPQDTSISRQTTIDSSDAVSLPSLTPRESRSSTVSSTTNLKPSPAKAPPLSSRKISVGPKGLGMMKSTASTGITSAEVTTSRATEKQAPNPTVLSQQLKNSLRRKPSQQSIRMPEPRETVSSPPPPSQPSHPIEIKDAVEKEKADQADAASTVKPQKMIKNSDGLAGTIRKIDSIPTNSINNSSKTLTRTNSPTAAMSPWLTLLNPSNPKKENMSVASQYRRWQHVFPHAVSVSAIKWKSLCSPAVLPLTSEYFPTSQMLKVSYMEASYRVSIDDDEEGISRDMLIKELVSARLSNGFQIVIGEDAESYCISQNFRLLDFFDPQTVVSDGSIILLSIGNNFHRLLCLDRYQIEVKRYLLKPSVSGETKDFDPIVYDPRVRTILADTYEKRSVIFRNPRSKYDWSQIDNYIGGGKKDSLPEDTHHWRARFVLIPVDPPKGGRGPLAPLAEVSEEETRLEGIQKLTQILQRNRYIPPDGRKFQASVQQRRKDPNPLAIDYQTRDLSAVVRAHASGTADHLLGEPVPLFAEADLYHTNDFDLQKLAHHMQAPPPRGVAVVDRRWHWKLYYRCFRGDEFTTWLVGNFKDMETREDAVRLGNELMKRGLFVHVQHKHHFRDGNYFYQVASDYRRTPHPDSRAGWFSRMTDRSVPSTPSLDSPKTSPLAEKGRPGTEDSDSSGTKTPTRAKSRLELSRMLQYDVDPRKRSDRPEIINVHYDRIHNPDNAYHIRIEWMNVTSKLIEDTVSTWAGTVERYGLKLAEVPLAEACAITKQHPFRAPYSIELALRPPTPKLRAVFDTTSFAPAHDERFPFQKQLLRKFDYVLDYEAAQNFDLDLDVTYSWGKPDYKYTQFIHKSGLLLVQIDDAGNFLVLANRLFVDRGSKEINKPTDRRTTRSPFASPLVRASDAPLTPGFGPLRHPRATHSSYAYLDPSKPVNAEAIRLVLERFCHNEDELAAFYEEALKPPASPSPRHTPVLRTTNVTSHGMNESIPSLGLPPTINMPHRAISYAHPQPMSSSVSLSRDAVVGPREVMSRGRRASTQEGI